MIPDVVAEVAAGATGACIGGVGVAAELANNWACASRFHNLCYIFWGAVIAAQAMQPGCHPAAH